MTRRDSNNVIGRAESVYIYLPRSSQSESAEEESEDEAPGEHERWGPAALCGPNPDTDPGGDKIPDGEHLHGDPGGVREEEHAHLPLQRFPPPSYRHAPEEGRGGHGGLPGKRPVLRSGLDVLPQQIHRVHPQARRGVRVRGEARRGEAADLPARNLLIRFEEPGIQSRLQSSAIAFLLPFLQPLTPPPRPPGSSSSTQLSMG